MKKVDFQGYRITLEEVMEQFDSSGKEMYEDIVDELLEDAEAQVHPFALWKEVAVAHFSQDAVRIENCTFDSAYLAGRLDGVDKAYAFIVTIGKELWNCRNHMSDALEQYLFDAIMKTCLDFAFAQTAEEIVKNLPDKMGLYMDNPGHLSGESVGWKLEDQRKFLQLFRNSEHGLDQIQINDRDLFETSYSLSGVIYAKGEETANCVLCPKPECSHRKKEFDRKELACRLHRSTMLGNI